MSSSHVVYSDLEFGQFLHRPEKMDKSLEEHDYFSIALKNIRIIRSSHDCNDDSCITRKHNLIFVTLTDYCGGEIFRSSPMFIPL